MVIFRRLTIVIFLLCGIPAFGNEKPPQEFAAMRSALCDQAADFTETGCRVCPQFMAKGSEGRLELRGTLEINSVLLGSFTSVGRTEALLSSGSCFSHADGFASAFLLRKEQGSWRRLSFFHMAGPMGNCWKIPGQDATRDFVVCNEADYGQGAISVMGFDVSGKVKTNSELVQTWTNPIRTLEKQKHCSSLSADIKKVSFNSVEVPIFLNSFDVDPPINCFDEAEGTNSKISNSKKVEGVAVFVRANDSFAPDEGTRKLLSEVEKSR